MNAADTKVVEGNDYKFPTEMTFDEVDDESIKQGSIDLVKDMFEHIIQNNDYIQPFIPHLKPKFFAWSARGTLSEFDQSVFSDHKNVERTGLIYVPHACKKLKAQCRTHIAFHGVGQGYADMKAKNKNLRTEDYAFATQTGYVQYGASNDFIIMFP